MIKVNPFTPRQAPSARSVSSPGSEWQFKVHQTLKAPQLIDQNLSPSNIGGDFSIVFAFWQRRLAALERKSREWTNFLNFDGFIRPIRKFAVFALCDLQL
jgi:hypothetical protein